MGLVAGVVALNVVLLALGYAVLWGLALRIRVWDAGLALVVGAGIAGALVFLATIVGARANVAALVTACAVSVVAALVTRRLRLARESVADARADGVALVLAGGLAAVANLALVGGFRSSPWLDDVWGIWVPEGVALLHHGLDARLFAPNATYTAFEVPDYPMWWSALAALDVEFVGSVDLRAVNAQLALLAVAFLGAAARLLTRAVRPWLAFGAVALVALSPEFFRHAQGGVADLPLAIYVSLAALCGALWLEQERAFLLVLAGLFAAIAVQVKTEGLAEIAILLAVGLVAARRRLPLAIAGAAALASAIPWLVWQRAQHVPARTPLTDALDVTHLSERSDRVWPTVRELAANLVDPTQWLLIVPLLFLASVALAVRRRNTRPLVTPTLVGLLAAFLVVAYTANQDELEFLLATSAYRVVDPLVLTAAVLLPFPVERLLRR